MEPCSTLVNTRSADSMTSVGSSSVLLPGTGSGVVADTLAMFNNSGVAVCVSVTPEPTVPTMTIVTEAPAANVA